MYLSPRLGELIIEQTVRDSACPAQSDRWEDVWSCLLASVLHLTTTSDDPDTVPQICTHTVTPQLPLQRDYKQGVRRQTWRIQRIKVGTHVRAPGANKTQPHVSPAGVMANDVSCRHERRRPLLLAHRQYETMSNSPTDRSSGPSLLFLH
jgi:hypothetical protein